MFVGIQSLLKFCMCDRCMLLVNTSNGKCCFYSVSLFSTAKLKWRLTILCSVIVGSCVVYVETKRKI